MPYARRGKGLRFHGVPEAVNGDWIVATAAGAHASPGGIMPTASYEKPIGTSDPNWRPDWYAEYMVREQAGAELQS